MTARRERRRLDGRGRGRMVGDDAGVGPQRRLRARGRWSTGPVDGRRRLARHRSNGRGGRRGEPTEVDVNASHRRRDRPRGEDVAERMDVRLGVRGVPVRDVRRRRQQLEREDCHDELRQHEGDAARTQGPADVAIDAMTRRGHQGTVAGRRCDGPCPRPSSGTRPTAALAAAIAVGAARWRFRTADRPRRLGRRRRRHCGVAVLRVRRRRLRRADRAVAASVTRCAPTRRSCRPRERPAW